MTEFNYTARTKTGTTQTGTISASSKAAAIAAIKQKDLQPVIIKSAKKGGNLELHLPGKSGIKAKDIVIFTRQFATMIGAGVPMLQSLTTMKEQSESEPLKKLLDKVVAHVQGGGQLSDALAQHPKVFSEVYVNMVRAGESGGILDQILERLATQVEKDTEIKSKVKGAMIYPIVVSLIAVGAVVFLMIGIIPKLTGILKDAEVELPVQTKLVIFISDFLREGWPIIIVGIVVAAVAFRQIMKQPKGKYVVHRLILKAPIFGKLVLKVNVARFARTFSSLLAAGVSVIEALEVTSGALSNVVIKKALQDSISQIKNGSNVADSLGASHILPGIIIQMTAVGEETGQLDTVLNKVAEFYEKEVDTAVAGMTSIIEPILIVGLGGIVGFIVASVLGPISALQGSV